MGDSSTDPDRAVGDAESAFETLSHDLRLEILRALWDAPGFSLSFSELRKTVGARDSGSFTYHLKRLQGHFVAKTDDGYELQYPGHRVLDAIQSGVFHEQVTVGPVELDASCPDCGDPLSFTYGTDFVARVRCSDCGNRTLEWPFDPGGVQDREPDEVVDAFDRRTRHVWACALDGVCPFCAGRVTRTFAGETEDGGACVGVVEQLDRYDEFYASDHPVVVATDCEHCSFYSFLPVGVVLLTRPAVASRLEAGGVDLHETPLWAHRFVVDPDALSVQQTDPPSVAVTIESADDTLSFVVDESLTVTTPRPNNT